MDPITNQAGVVVLWVVIALAGLSALAGLKFWVLPWIRIWIEGATDKWWINIVAPLMIVVGVVVWGAFWTGAFGYMYHESKIRIPRLEIISDIRETWNRSKAAWEGDLKTATEPTAEPGKAVPGAAPTPQSSAPIKEQAPAASGGSSSAGGGSGCKSEWCTGGACADGCGAVGAPGFVCTDGTWVQNWDVWNKAPKAPDCK
ncbi:hypothetical protein A3H78_01675 [Candidatus Roizmanbacteria bacterium RIFCSPLOWO2_02_FULL_36_11]|uniref:Uncharacterized protein n=1 Tax=Candidatus Roizmanbacteria bacterium RIFCSPLOWO2_02_FULL_36_11 TaxID=1802071 RepID=A0A1F7JG40_9BACT|nr:MAG: hypothetical protein A3H78_01675 [Candidatus Roizmanbacteria bacterium RIFCSPLOWO2_02_FULL_36_11]